LGAENFADLQRGVFLSILDSVWVEHLTYLEQLRKGIFLRAYGQKDPLIEFQKEGFRLFELMMIRVRDTFLEYIFHISEAAAEASKAQHQAKAMITEKADMTSMGKTSSTPAPENGRASGVIPMPGKAAPVSPSAAIPVEKIGRNDDCPCGSGKKYKKCHGK
jgi:preprotein translocase subunit SecA